MYHFSYILWGFGGEKMLYQEFLSGLQKELNKNGVRISQDKLKILFETTGNFIMENIEFADKIGIKEFIVFELVKISPKKLPDGTMSKEQFGMKIRLSGKYKQRVKEHLNK